MCDGQSLSFTQIVSLNVIYNILFRFSLNLTNPTTLDFSESCIGNYTSLLVNIDEYNKTHVNPLKEQLTSLQTDCEPSVGLLSNKVDLLEKRVEVWAVNILLNLKNLMEARFNHLRDASKYHCHRLNEMRLASKGMSFFSFFFFFFFFFYDSYSFSQSMYYILV